ncbi:type II methionyl aminopeptidase [Methanoplanus sp. FWC-SCC4]|uniref:Methionine aminopeptidase n=1 Tax=Methanochimaera problematica TaxID=2609417 RepID=A0AA97FD58_9EURY|nr:type II methionyl aminopeptidase [Methanoplanus sp. FWC-SCC4]WOF16692.1 type II methionyl aminopeptidase [Methanoplanus sp. FWC-SCC4]
MMDEEIVELYKQAGDIAKKCLANAAARVKPDASILDLVEVSEAEIIDMGGEIAFPLNISLNNNAAHDTASAGDTRCFSKGDVVKVDMGVHIDGYVADTAMTVDLGKNDLLVEASRSALNTAISMVKPGVTTGEIGAAVQKEIERRGYRPVSNLTGHGLGKYLLHGIPTIPNVGMSGGTVIEEGMSFAIEPFATTGSGQVTDGPRAEIFSQISNRNVRLPSAKKLLSEIKTRQSLPFARRWYSGKSEIALAQLYKQGIIRGYPVLHDIPGSLVSQAEHTVIVTEDGCIITTA